MSGPSVSHDQNYYRRLNELAAEKDMEEKKEPTILDDILRAIMAYTERKSCSPKHVHIGGMKAYGFIKLTLEDLRGDQILYDEILRSGPYAFEGQHLFGTQFHIIRAEWDLFKDKIICSDTPCENYDELGALLDDTDIKA